MPVESLFIFLLIISGNFLAELFNCRFQKKTNRCNCVKTFFWLFNTPIFCSFTNTPS